MPAIRGRKRAAVQTGARGICEYCRLAEKLVIAGVPQFEAEHIRPASLFSPGDPKADDLNNLAWACPRCNRKKSDQTDGLDQQAGQRSRLFNPRTDRWIEHFVALPSGHILGLTTIGRATVYALKFNEDAPAVKNRALFSEMKGLWPAW